MNAKPEKSTGESPKRSLGVGFDGRLELEFHGSRVTSDAGLFAHRELDDALNLTSMANHELSDQRTGGNTKHSMAALFKQSVFSRLAGYEDTNDADRLCVDPAMRYAVGGSAGERQTAFPSQMSRFETEVLTHKENLDTPRMMPGMWNDQIHMHRPIKQLILNMDSSVSETYEEQDGNAYNGHFACTCCHPFFCFNQFICDNSITTSRGYFAPVEEYFLMSSRIKGLRIVESGQGREHATGFSNRIKNSFLIFHPVVVTICYGMNDGGYSSMSDETGKAYRDALTKAVEQLKAGGVRIIIVMSLGLNVESSEVAHQ